MKLSVILYSLLAGLVIYCLLLLAYGDTGFRAIVKAETYKSVLSENLEKLREINRELTVDFDALSSDDDLIKIKARALGYYEKDDHLVHIEKWNPDADEYRPGFIVKREYRTDVSETPFRIAGLTGFFIVFAIGSLLDFSFFRKKKHVSF